MPILADLCRVRYRTPEHRAGEPRLLVAAPKSRLSSGLYRATVELPREPATLTLAAAEGHPLPALAIGIVGERDPLHGKRSRSQMGELVVWLGRGEIHEYVLRDCQVACEAGELRLTANLWPAWLGYAAQPNPAAAQQLSTALADPAVTHFFVHLRMPRRFAVAFALDEDMATDHLVLHVAPVFAEKADEATEDKRTIHFFAEDALAVDPSELSLVVQLT
jgi:hypothetical protein